MPDFSFEIAAIKDGINPIAGVDEVGRGPLSGPVMAAAVILDPHNIPPGLADSKKLTAKRREVLFELIIASSEFCVAQASVQEIDQINILQASLLAMRRALGGLPRQPAHALIDGNRLPPDLPYPAQAIVKGDDRSLSIAAASIVAKVTRDRMMTALASEFPGYGWENNAGYGTKQHLEGLSRLGATPHHRVSFKPVHNILYQQKN
ncbi:MAG: ribonuclease HII [Paracoccaceae bacterium]|jgi:ribonuclease HII